MEKEIAKRFIKGISASPGIVIGKARVFQDIFLRVERRGVEEDRVEQEVLRLMEAIHHVTEELDKIILEGLRYLQAIKKQTFSPGEGFIQWPENQR